MSSMRLLNLIGTIDDDLINEALEYKGKPEVKKEEPAEVTPIVTPVARGRHRTLIISLVSAAACITLILGVMFMLPRSKSTEESAKSADTHNAATNEILEGIDAWDLTGDYAPAAEATEACTAEGADEEEVEGFDSVESPAFYSSDLDKSDNSMTLRADPEIKVSLKVNNIANGSMSLSYVLNDDNDAGSYYTYDGLFRIVTVENRNTFDYNWVIRPSTTPDENADKIPLDKGTTDFEFPYESEYGTLPSGEYMIVGYVYSTDGDGSPKWVGTTIVIP